jgi:hypothetical protein
MIRFEEINDYIDAAIEFMQAKGHRRYQRGARLVGF